MADGVRPALGLSIGSTNLAAVTAENALTRKPVLTLYRQRPPEVGVPSENPRLDAPGVVTADFVDRVGDPAGIVAADGSLHRSEALIADALRALAYAATGGGALPDNMAVSYPAHWSSAAVDAVGGALSRVSEWSNRARPLVLIPDAAAALFAARANPGIPAGGTVAVCDFGGTGTSITLMDATADYRSLAPTLRYHDFSGNLIDQALLTAVMGNVPSRGPFDPASTLASGSLSRLRGECRSAKEQLSSITATTLADDLPGLQGDFQLTRNELDEVIRDSLNRFVSVLEETLRRNGIGDLSAIAAVGGGANIPAVTRTLSGRLGIPVITTPRPQLTPAVGAALRAARHPGDPVATMAGPSAGVPATAAAPQAQAGTTGTAEALAWPQRSEPRAMPTALPVVPAPSRDTEVRLPVQPEETPSPNPEPPPKVRWYRRPPAVAAVGVAGALLLAGLAAALTLHSTNKPATAPPPAPSATTTVPAAAPSSRPASAPASPAPAQESAPPPSDTNPPATAEPPSATAPPAAPQAQPPVVAAPAAPAILPAIPELPPIPGINEPIPGLDRLNQILQEFGRFAR